MQNHGATATTSHEQRNALRRVAEEESTLRYRLRNQNFCLVVLLLVGVLTVTCACGAIVYAIVEHFWTPLRDVDEASGSGTPSAGGNSLVLGSHAAEVEMQRLPQSDQTGRGAVFCFVNHSVSSGSPHRFEVDNVTATLCDALVFVSVSLVPQASGLSFRRPTHDAEMLQGLVSLSGTTAAWACVGGEPSDSADFQWLVSDRKMRLAFFHNAVAWSRRMGVAGLLLYWKYPPRQSRSSYNTFINTMRAVFERDSLRLSVVLPWAMTTRRDGYFVPVTVPPPRVRRGRHAPNGGPTLISDGDERLAVGGHVHPQKAVVQARGTRYERRGSRPPLWPHQPVRPGQLLRRDDGALRQCVLAAGDARVLSLLDCPPGRPVDGRRGPGQPAGQEVHGAQDGGSSRLGPPNGRLRRRAWGPPWPLLHVAYDLVHG
ncbi:hypothetical protein MRX96_004401 [Rhipicephalus microplus]